MIEDKPGRGESEEAGIIRDKNLKEQDHSGQKILGETEVTENENELEEKPPERGSDRKKEHPGRENDMIEDQPGRGEFEGSEVQRASKR